MATGLGPVDPGLLAAIDGRAAHGTYLNAATARYPAVVLGAPAARLLGVADLDVPQQVHIGGHDCTVVGILEPIVIAPEIDQTAMLGFAAAEALLGFDGAATRLYVRSDPDQVSAVRQVLARTTNPESPEATVVSLPSELLAARDAARNTFGALYFGLGAVALLVGGVGIANVMVISVLERRSEIGLRRALGATRVQIGAQFLVEAVLLAIAGGAAGTALGATAAALAARVPRWPLVIPGMAIWGGLTAAVIVGAVAGLYPAARAARLAPTEALRSV
jgi:putative ABC transport system permease protein